MKHITFTGILAGQTYCGALRNQHDTYAHLGAWIDNVHLTDVEVCVKCMKVYADSFKEDGDALEVIERQTGLTFELPRKSDEIREN